MVVSIALAVFLVDYKEPLIALFTKEHDVTELSIKIMPIVGIKFIFDGMQGYLQGVIRGLGLQQLGSIIALIVAYVIQIPLSVILAFKLHWGIAGLWWADAFCMMIQGISYYLLSVVSDWDEITKNVLKRIQDEKFEISINSKPSSEMVSI